MSCNHRSVFGLPALAVGLLANYTKMRGAAQGLNVVDCLKVGRFDAYGAYNGINN